MITVMGATGRVGKRVTNLLLQAGSKVRALGRSPEKLEALRSAGAQTGSGDMDDAAFLADAFRGAAAVFTLLPYDVAVPGYYANQTKLSEAIVHAIAKSRVRYVVFLSSIGADQAGGTGPIDSLHDHETRLRQLANTNVLMLCPGSFFENFHASMPVIKHEGLNADGFTPDLAIPMTATRDIADTAVRALRLRDWKGVVVRELLGPRDLSYAEATRLIGAAIGKPDLAYVQLPYADLRAVFIKAGFAADVADVFVELARGINEGRIRTVERRNGANTTPTRFEDFAIELARSAT